LRVVIHARVGPTVRVRLSCTVKMDVKEA